MTKTFRAISWPHYFVGDGESCLWCGRKPSDDHRLELPNKDPYTRRALVEDASTAMFDGVDVDLTTARRPVARDDEVLADHERRKADADAFVAKMEAAGVTFETPVSPHHYGALSPQPIQVVAAWNLNFYFANTLKYIARFNETDNLDDVRKAKRYLEFFLNSVERGDPLADPA